MSRFKITSVLLATVAMVGGCAAPPLGPTVQVMPPPGKPFEVFAQDQGYCKQYASSQVAGQSDQANNQAVGGALLGTALGAGLGAAVGGGRGAAIGAASGAVVGTGYGAGNSQNAQYGIQAQYDNAYAQCMYSRGNQVPGYAPAAPPPPPPGWTMPPPPR
jgi:hypothetical protein